MNEFRLLKANEIECRVQLVKQTGCSLLLYKTARTDRQILTETFGNLWQNDFKTLDGKMYGGIGVWNEDLKQWLWRWDCGSESNTEKEKGEASDCFKRAGFKWGIGVELYSAPFIWIPNCDVMPLQNGGFRVKDTFSVKSVIYTDDREIKDIVIVNQEGKVVYQKLKTKP